MLPSTHRALVVKDDGEQRSLIVTEKYLPTFGDEDILIKVQAVTLNPTDWKHFRGWGIFRGALKDGSSIGCDFSGVVVAVGKGVKGKGWKIGDAAAGFLRGGVPDPNNGTFQEYVASHADLAWHVPTDVLSHEDAAAMGGIALSTAIQVLYHRLELAPPWAPTKEAIPILIWAGSTSVGIYAIRLAKLSGLTVVTTASPKNYDLMKELGADAVFDYKDPKSPAKIKQWSGGRITKGLDAISVHGSAELAAEAFSDDGGQLITLVPINKPKNGSALSTNVEPVFTHVYSALDPSEGSDYKSMHFWYQKAPNYAEQLKVMPLKKWEGGLDAIPEALAYLEAGYASAEKISLLI